MRLSVLQETQEEETRVALSPEAVKKLVKKGFSVIVQKDAGLKATYTNESYVQAGAEISDPTLADIILCVNRPSNDLMEKIRPQTLLIGFLNPFEEKDFFKLCAHKNISALSVELIPRISRAQSMDALSSQANVAGYQAVIEAAYHYKRFFPLMMTAAGSAKAAKVFILGAGVAGLQAIATARRLGAIVEAYDIRPDVKEQIESLGAKFFDLQVIQDGSGQGGYAKELTESQKQLQQKALTEKLKKSDIVISTASIPGKKAPRLITQEAVLGMRAGSVVVDLAAATGGNCEYTEPGKIVVKNGVTIIGLKNLTTKVATDASHFYAQNLVALLELIVKPHATSLEWDWKDEIISACVVVHDGQVRQKEA